MDKIELGNLFSQYGKMLTLNQQDILHDYLILDMGISEIAEIRQITRQAIKSVINVSVKKLKSIEVKLGGI